MTSLARYATPFNIRDEMVTRSLRRLRKEPLIRSDEAELQAVTFVHHDFGRCRQRTASLDILVLTRPTWGHPCVRSDLGLQRLLRTLSSPTAPPHTPMQILSC